MAAKSRAIVANNVHIVQQLAFDGLQDQNVALLQVCALVVSCLALGQLLQVLLRGCDELAPVDGREAASPAGVYEHVHAFLLCAVGKGCVFLGASALAPGRILLLVALRMRRRIDSLEVGRRHLGLRWDAVI